MTRTLRQSSDIYMKEIRLANKIISTLVKDHVHYPDRLIADTFAMIARCGILLALYWYVFQLNGGVVNGVTYQVAAWSMFFYFSFSTLRLRDISRSIMQDVQTGRVEVLFNKPISYLLYRFWWQIGFGVYSFVVVTILGAIALIWLIGLPASMTIAMFLPTMLLTLLGASLLSLILYGIVGLLAFWLEDINPVFWIVDKAVMILGGSYLAVALFPKFLYQIAVYSPFGASLFVTHTVYDSWRYSWYILLAWQWGWIIILSIVMRCLFARAQKKVSVNGG
jgi:ABC-2 type transport system permease protein